MVSRDVQSDQIMQTIEAKRGLIFADPLRVLNFNPYNIVK